MKPGDLAWHLLRGGPQLVTILEVRYWKDGLPEDGLPEWVRILTGDVASWTAASLLDVIDTSDATAG
jgi:hypothetical protein